MYTYIHMANTLTSQFTRYDFSLEKSQVTQNLGKSQVTKNLGKSYEWIDLWEYLPYVYMWEFVQVLWEFLLWEFLQVTSFYKAHVYQSRPHMNRHLLRHIKSQVRLFTSHKSLVFTSDLWEFLQVSSLVWFFCGKLIGEMTFECARSTQSRAFRDDWQVWSNKSKKRSI